MGSCVRPSSSKNNKNSSLTSPWQMPHKNKIRQNQPIYPLPTDSTRPHPSFWHHRTRIRNNFYHPIHNIPINFPPTPSLSFPHTLVYLACVSCWCGEEGRRGMVLGMAFQEWNRMNSSDRFAYMEGGELFHNIIF